MQASLQHLVLRDTYPLLFCLKPQNDGPLLEQTLASTLFPPEHHLHKRTHNSINWNDWRTRTRVIFIEHLRQVQQSACPQKNPPFECHFLLFEVRPDELTTVYLHKFHLKSLSINNKLGVSSTLCMVQHLDKHVNRCNGITKKFNGPLSITTSINEKAY